VLHRRQQFQQLLDLSQPGVADRRLYRHAAVCREVELRAESLLHAEQYESGYLPDGTLAPAVQRLPPSTGTPRSATLEHQNIAGLYFGGAYDDAAILAAEAVALNPLIHRHGTAASRPGRTQGHRPGCGLIADSRRPRAMSAGNGEAHIKDTADLITDIQNNTLPAVSIGKPDGILDGHPQSSKLDLFEAYVQNVLEALEDNSELKKSTAVFITWDEAGGYWDSGSCRSRLLRRRPRMPLLVLARTRPAAGLRTATPITSRS
jgi:phospholipase C